MSADGNVTVSMRQKQLAPLANVPTREMIQRFESELRAQISQGQLQAIEDNAQHTFAGGIYSRQILIPKGAWITGKIHRTAHLNIMASGDITVWTDDGMKRLQGYNVIPGTPGTKRVGYAHEDTIWVTLHATHETNLDLLE